MTTRSKHFTRVALFTAAATVPLLSQQAMGQARIWNGAGADANWSTGANWNVGTPPPLSAPTEGWRFGSTATQLVTNMDNSYTFGQLQFSDVGGYVINSNNGSTMSLAGFNNGQAIALLAPNIATNVATVNVPIALVTGNANPGNATEVNRRTFNTDVGTLLLNGAINAGAFDVRKIGGGSLTLGAANSFASTYEATNGVTRLGNDLALGTATVLVANGAANTVRYTSSNATARTIANPFTLSGAGVLAFGQATGEVGSGDITLTGPISLNDATNTTKTIAVLTGGTATINGVISGTNPASGIQKNNPGTLVLNAINLYTGQTTVGNGTLRLNGRINGPASVGGGVLEGTGTVGGGGLGVFDVDLADTNVGGFIAPGTDGTVGQLKGSTASFGHWRRLPRGHRGRRQRSASALRQPHRRRNVGQPVCDHRKRHRLQQRRERELHARRWRDGRRRVRPDEVHAQHQRFRTRRDRHVQPCAGRQRHEPCVELRRGTGANGAGPSRPWRPGPAASSSGIVKPATTPKPPHALRGTGTVAGAT